MVGKGGLGDVHLLKDVARADIVLVLDSLVDAQARGVAQRLERRREALVVHGFLLSVWQRITQIYILTYVYVSPILPSYIDIY